MDSCRGWDVRQLPASSAKGPRARTSLESRGLQRARALELDARRGEGGRSAEGRTFLDLPLLFVVSGAEDHGSPPQPARPPMYGTVQRRVVFGAGGSARGRSATCVIDLIVLVVVVVVAQGRTSS